MATLAQASATTPPSVWTGRVLSGLAAAFLLVDAGSKLAAPAMVAANSPDIGWSLDPVTIRTLGLLLIVPTLLYIWPRTAFLGAILITGYLGGAIATHMRIGSPLFTHILFGVYLALLVWGGLWLRSPALRALLPFHDRKD
ncbi:MAG: DoxX family protein [Porphyrobacter sp.]|nr:DoxX family protein [Porphyrobacter sp.]